MFNDLLQDSGNKILVARLQRAISSLVSANYSTLEDYQTAIYSSVNSILGLQNNMQPITNIKSGTPALIGNLTTNIANLNNDASDTVTQLNSVENDMASLFNLGELAQTSIRQVLRQQVFANNINYYNENFISNDNIQTNTATIDNLVGAAFLPLSSQTALTFSVALGTKCIGSSSSAVSYLTDGAINTSYIWNGNSLELILSFSSPQIINRLSFDLDTYDGLEITTLTSSPDGNSYYDILSVLEKNSISLNSQSGKYSGVPTIDFPPQYALNIRIIIQNVIGSDVIALRNLYAYSRQYASSGQLTSTLISNPVCPVSFSVDQLTDSTTNIIHQYSYDNVHFIIMNPGEITFSGPYWYRALLSRSSLTTSSNGIVGNPTNNTNYQVVSSTTLNLGSNITERNISFSTISGPVVFSEVPLPGTFKVQIGSSILNPSQYTFLDNTLTLNSSQSNVNITYQLTGLNAQILSTMQNYDSPILREYTFEA